MDNPSQTTHPFDLAVTLQPQNNAYRAELTPAYHNMVGPFGGITAAIVLNSVLQHPEALGTPVAFTVNYLGPMDQSAAIELKPELVRANRSNQHWRIDLIQEDQILCNATLILAKGHQAWENQEVQAPNVTPFEQLPRVVEESFPPWIKQYDIRVASGSPFPDTPHNPDKPSETLVWMCDKPARKLDFCSLTALCDAFFPRLYVRLKKRSPIGTVSLTIHFHVDDKQLQLLDSPLVLGHARASAFQRGYFDQTAEVYSQSGKLLATTSQIVYYKD